METSRLGFSLIGVEDLSYIIDGVCRFHDLQRSKLRVLAESWDIDANLTINA